MKSSCSTTITSIRTCPEKGRCRHAIIDSHALGAKLEQLVFPVPLPNKVKISIAGCKRCCTEPFVRDVGIIAARKGWTVVFGGNAGGNPRIADILAEGLNDEEAFDLVKKSLEFYQKHAKPRQRTARFIESFGIDRFKKQVL